MVFSLCAWWWCRTLRQMLRSLVSILDVILIWLFFISIYSFLGKKNNKMALDSVMIVWKCLIWSGYELFADSDPEVSLSKIPCTKITKILYFCCSTSVPTANPSLVSSLHRPQQSECVCVCGSSNSQLYISNSQSSHPDVMMESYAVKPATPIFFIVYIIVVYYITSNVVSSSVHKEVSA